MQKAVVVRDAAGQQKMPLDARIVALCLPNADLDSAETILSALLAAMGFRIVPGDSLS